LNANINIGIVNGISIVMILILSLLAGNESILLVPRVRGARDQDVLLYNHCELFVATSIGTDFGFSYDVVCSATLNWCRKGFSFLEFLQVLSDLRSKLVGNVEYGDATLLARSCRLGDGSGGGLAIGGFLLGCSLSSSLGWAAAPLCGL
jgi:hypothetical protein